MEWNAKPPSNWEWENFISFSAKPTENPKKLRPADWLVDGMGGADLGPFHSPGVGAGGSSGSDLGYTSSTKSSKSASTGSPSIGEMNPFRPQNESAEIIPEMFSRKEFANIKQTDSPTFEASVGSGEPLLSLELGKQTYFEDASGRSNAKSSSFSVIPVPSLGPAKRSKSNRADANPPRCQVEGCNLDLSSAKDYHRKHRVCESHSKCPKVIIGGLERRFCQQCSRFHGLSEFDEKKRSCRKRLSDHNARRRKPQSEPGRLNSANPYLSFTDGRQQINFALNKVPLFHSKPTTNFTWGSTDNSMFMKSKGYMVKPTKTGSSSGQLNVTSNGTPNFTNASHDSNRLYSSKTEYPVQGVSPMSSNLVSAQDFHRALSLLSTSSGVSCEPKPRSLDHAMCAAPSSMNQVAIHAEPQSLPAAFPDFCQSDGTETEMPALAAHNYESSHYQEFQQLKAPYEGFFYA